MLGITVDPTSYKRAQAALDAFPGQFRAALWQSVKRGLSTVRSEAINEITKVSYLKKATIRKAITSPQMYGSSRRGKVITKNDTIMGWVRVSRQSLLDDNYKFIPNRVTARRGKRPEQWTRAGLKYGPNERVRYWDEDSDRSAAFIIRGITSKKLRYVRRFKTEGLSVKSNKTRMTSNRTGKFSFVTGPSVWYFVNFTSVKSGMFEKAHKTIETRLRQEVKYRLTKLGAI